MGFSNGPSLVQSSSSLMIWMMGFSACLKSVDDIELGGIADTLEGRVRIQKDLDRLENGLPSIR